MRDKMNECLKQELRTLAIRTRAELSLSQHAMAERLLMHENSYWDIEAGHSMCGSLTVILLLLAQDDPSMFLHEVEQSFSQLYEKEMMAI